MPIGVITESSLSQTFVASNSPPRPASKTIRSQFSKTTKASKVVYSKYVRSSLISLPKIEKSF